MSTRLSSLTGKTILIVDNDPVALDFFTAALECSGCHVLSAANPSSALQLAEENHDSIDLLLTDVSMPEMNGFKLAEKIRVLVSNIRIVFITGYIANMELCRDQYTILMKPLTITELQTAVATALISK